MGILLAWHYVSRQPWRVSRKVLFGMACESLGSGRRAMAFLELVPVFLAGRVAVGANGGQHARTSRTGWGPSTPILEREFTKNFFSA